MAFTVTTVAATLASIDQALHTCGYNMNGSWSGNDLNAAIKYRFNINGANSPLIGGGSTQTNDTFTQLAGLNCDETTTSYWAIGVPQSDYNTETGTDQPFKTDAVTASATAPSTSSITSSSVVVNCNFYPNTSQSSASAQLQYKKSVDSSWINFGSPKSSSGYAQDSVGSTSLTGLLSSTSYDLRLSMTRTTNNGTTLTSATTTFSTTANATFTLSANTGNSERSVGTTSAVIAIANNTGSFNYTNSGTLSGTIYYRIKHDDNSGFSSPSYTASTNDSVAGYVVNAAFNTDHTITGLSANTAYWYKLQFCADNSTWVDATGSSGTFTTTNSPTPPTAAFTIETPAGTTGTAVHLVHFIDSATNTPTSWIWNFGDGSGTATAQSPYKSYVTAGTYTVTQTVSNADGTDSEVKTSFITILSGLPAAGFHVSSSIGTRPFTVNFIDDSTKNPIRWQWTIPDGQTTRTLYTQAASHVYQLAGSYTATLTASNYLGSSSTSVTNCVTVKPISVSATFTGGPLSGPPPLSVQFIGTPSGDSTGVAWNFGDGFTTTDLNPLHTYYGTNSTYTVSYTVYGTTVAGGAVTSTSTATRTSFIKSGISNTYKVMLEDLRTQLLMNTESVDLCSDFQEWGGIANILRYIYNRICRIQLEAGPLRKTSTTITSTEPGILTLPSDLIEIRSIYVDGVRLEKCDPRMADLNDQNWEIAPTGDYQGWFVNPADHLKLHIVPAITPATFECYYVYAPTEPTVPGTCAGTWDDLPLPFVFWWIVKYGVLADMLNHEGEMYDIERAKMCEQMFQEGLELIRLSLGDK